MIHPGEISKLAHRLGLADKTIEKDYVLTWVLLAIANSPLRGQLAFLIVVDRVPLQIIYSTFERYTQ